MNEIPLLFARRLLPPQEDPRDHMMVYTITECDRIDTEGRLYRLPFALGACWTHVRFQAFSGIHRLQLRVHMSDDTHRLLLEEVEPVRWHPTPWPLPSVPSLQAGFYLRVVSPPEHAEVPVIVSLIGFRRLFPLASVYHLDSPAMGLLLTYEGEESTYHETRTVPEGGVGLRPLSEY